MKSMRFRGIAIGLCGLWLAASSVFATNRAVMVESAVGTQALPGVSLGLLPGMFVFSTTGIARIYFNPTGDTHLAIQADLMDVVSPSITNLWLGSNLFLYVVGGGSNPVLRIGGDGMDVQVGPTNPAGPASVVRRVYVDGQMAMRAGIVATNVDTSGGDVSFTLPGPTNTLYYFSKTNALNNLMVVYGALTSTVSGIALVDAIPINTNYWVVRY